ncbi:hypothetical protein B0T16DRAFT_499615, partial [Cercophora newfieldiana]
QLPPSSNPTSRDRFRQLKILGILSVEYLPSFCFISNFARPPLLPSKMPTTAGDDTALLYRVAGFEGLSLPGRNHSKLREALQSPHPFSSQQQQDAPVNARDVVVNNTIVLFRLILWHKDIRGHKKFGKLLVQSWGVELDGEGAHNLRNQIYRWWQLVIRARERHLEKGRRLVPSAASDAERRLISLVDKARDDIEKRDLYPRASPQHGGALLRSDPKALLDRDPELETDYGKASDEMDGANVTGDERAHR